MSYYTPTFANINSGWYRKTTDENYSIDRNSIDIFWNEMCDNILINYVQKYGCFYRAFNSIIKKEIENVLNVSFKKYRYYEYYFQNRVNELGYYDYLLNSYQENKNNIFICNCCKIEEKYDFLHPEVMCKIFPPKYCRECYYIVRNYLNTWNNEVENLINIFVNKFNKTNNCKICNKEFIIKKEELFNNNLFVPFSHLNIFSSICQKCLRKTINKNINLNNKNEQYKYLLELTNHLNKVPTQDFYSLYYLFNDENNLIKLTKILQKLWLPEIFKEIDGSFFASLVHAGVLPEGSKKLKIGTMVLALDNHLCFSLIEKEIDDYLFLNNILHQKEIKYPNSDLRCDWEINYKNKKYFVEYFGLMNIKEYALKVEIKKKIALENNIILIELYPNMNWKCILNDIFKK